MYMHRLLCVRLLVLTIGVFCVEFYGGLKLQVITCQWMKFSPCDEKCYLKFICLALDMYRYWYIYLGDQQHNIYINTLSLNSVHVHVWRMKYENAFFICYLCTLSIFIHWKWYKNFDEALYNSHRMADLNSLQVLKDMPTVLIRPSGDMKVFP